MLLRNTDDVIIYEDLNIDDFSNYAGHRHFHSKSTGPFGGVHHAHLLAETAVRGTGRYQANNDSGQKHNQELYPENILS
jgi:hypothetical protein